MRILLLFIWLSYTAECSAQQENNLPGKIVFGFLSSDGQNKKVLKPLNGGTIRKEVLQSATGILLYLAVEDKHVVIDEVEYFLVSYPKDRDPVEMPVTGFDIF